MDEPDLGKAGSGRSQELGHSRASSVTSVGSGSGRFEYFGWVYHLGVNKIGHEYCHLRFLFIRGKHVLMYKRNPHENPGIKPIRKGVVGPTLMIEELGRRKVNSGGAGGDIYVLRFFNRWDETKKGEIACATAGEVQKWMEAFDQAKQQAEYELSRGGSARNHLNSDDVIDLDGHRPRVKKYARGLKSLIKIGEGPENLLRQSSHLVSDMGRDGYIEDDVGDAVEAYEWKCVRTINGVRIFQDVAEADRGKGVIVKAVGVIDASADTAFEVLMNIERRQRYEWDMLTGDLEMIDSCDGHYDVVYGTFSPMYLSRWESKRDFIFSRQWFRGQDGTYTILQSPAVHKKKPRISGYSRTKLNPSTWEIKDLNTSMETDTPRCLVTQMVEIPSVGWWKWKKNHFSKFEKSIPYALLCQVAGLKEYIASNPSLKLKSAASIIQSKIPHVSVSSGESEAEGIHDEFYDALSGDSSSSDEESDTEVENKEVKMKLKNVAWAITSLALKRTLSDANRELDPNAAPFKIDPSQFNGSLRKSKDDADTDCWTSPNGTGFMIRGKTYLKDSSKVTGQEPLLKLIAVDWFKVDKSMDRIALHPKCLMQSEAGKKLPFVLVVNLQVPATPNYSLVLYYASDKPVKPNSLLAKFVDGSDMFRNARFKLIPSIVDGYWMVKRAVGSKACLLGKAVSCKYLRQDNFLEIDVDIGSSSVARSIIGLVLGYVTSIVVDLAILIEAKEEEELPEYILGTVRLNRLKIDSAVKLEA